VQLCSAEKPLTSVQVVDFGLHGRPVPQMHVTHVRGAADAERANSAEPASPAPMIFSACRRDVAWPIRLDSSSSFLSMSISKYVANCPLP
jgi:hypothetical protein